MYRSYYRKPIFPPGQQDLAEASTEATRPPFQTAEHQQAEEAKRCRARAEDGSPRPRASRLSGKSPAGRGERHGEGGGSSRARPAPSDPSGARPAGPGPTHLSLLEQAPPPPGRPTRLQPETKRGKEEGRREGSTTREAGRARPGRDPHASPLRRDRGSQPRWRPGEAGLTQCWRLLPGRSRPASGARRPRSSADFRFRPPKMAAVGSC